MLHEVLLSLSGHPSSLLDAVKQQPSFDSQDQDSFGSLSLPERELLMSIASLADLHFKLQLHTKEISVHHKSTACRAVAIAINSKQLVRFQDHILDIEKRILAKDSSSVGAYGIVPLASVVSEIEQWMRPLQWMWELVLFMNSDQVGAEKQVQCSSAQIIDHLRQSLHTGYPDIEEVVNDLTEAAETAWLRQLSTWILYGHLPPDGNEDFCIRHSSTDDDSLAEFSLVRKSLPMFVTPETSSSILFIGKSLDQIRTSGQRTNQSQSVSLPPELKLLSEHLQVLSDVKSPISASQLSRAVTSMRASLSRNTLQELLPLPEIVRYLRILRQFFLLDRGEFASTLINEADHGAVNRNHPASYSRNTTHDTIGHLPKEGEINAVLARTWATLLSTANEDELNEDIEFAQNLLSLAPQPGLNHDVAILSGHTSDQLRYNGSLFKDMLFSVPYILTMRIPAPFDLFLSRPQLDVYSDINAYLLALRRAQLRLGSLWKHTSLRRDYPSPLGPPQSNSQYGQKLLRIRRERRLSRSMSMRKVWATCGAGLFLVSEIIGYFEGEIIRESWQDLHKWTVPKADSRPSSSSTHRTMSAASHRVHAKSPSSTQDLAGSFASQASITAGKVEDAAAHDPETISIAHATFLSNLVHGLLLNDTKFPSEIRALLSHVDLIVVHIIHLQMVQQNLDLEADEGVVDTLTDYKKEERQTLLEIDRARKRLDGSMRSVVGRLRELDRERTGRGATFKATTEVIDATRVPSYEGWKGGGIDGLLMKLDFGSTVDYQYTNKCFS